MYLISQGSSESEQASNPFNNKLYQNNKDYSQGVSQTGHLTPVTSSKQSPMTSHQHPDSILTKFKENISIINARRGGFLKNNENISNETEYYDSNTFKKDSDQKINPVRQESINKSVRLDRNDEREEGSRRIQYETELFASNLNNLVPIKRHKRLGIIFNDNHNHNDKDRLLIRQTNSKILSRQSRNAIPAIMKFALRSIKRNRPYAISDIVSKIRNFLFNAQDDDLNLQNENGGSNFSSDNPNIANYLKNSSESNNRNINLIIDKNVTSERNNSNINFGIDSNNRVKIDDIAKEASILPAQIRKRRIARCSADHHCTGGLSCINTRSVLCDAIMLLI